MQHKKILDFVLDISVLVFYIIWDFDSIGHGADGVGEITSCSAKTEKGSMCGLAVVDSRGILTKSCALFSYVLHTTNCSLAVSSVDLSA